MIDAALAYIGAGWPVFPCARGGKVPATGRGFHDATLDPEQVRNWWTATPAANIGISTGAAGLVVVDVDAHDDGPDGWTSWCQLVTGHAPGGELVDTLEVLTPSGGAHVYFLAPAGEPVRNSASKLAPGIDVRGVGGYVVAAPSVTDAGRYELDREHPVAPCPAWLERLLRPAPKVRPAVVPRPHHRPKVDGYAAAALEAEVAEVVAAPVGTRNHRLNTAAFSLGQLVGAGKLDAGTVASALVAAALSAGLTERESSQTVESGLSAGIREPRAAA